MYETIHYIITILLNLALIILRSKCIFYESKLKTSIGPLKYDFNRKKSQKKKNKSLTNCILISKGTPAQIFMWYVFWSLGYKRLKSNMTLTLGL